MNPHMKYLVLRLLLLIQAHAPVHFSDTVGMVHSQRCRHMTRNAILWTYIVTQQLYIYINIMHHIPASSCCIKQITKTHTGTVYILGHRGVRVIIISVFTPYHDYLSCEH